MGNKHEEMKIRNQHSEEISRIEAMKEKNEQEAEIRRFAAENGFKLDLKRIENLAEQARMEHQRKLREIEYEREHKKDLVETERRKIEKEDLRERDRINKDHERKLKEISAKESNDRKDK